VKAGGKSIKNDMPEKGLQGVRLGKAAGRKVGGGRFNLGLCLCCALWLFANIASHVHMLKDTFACISVLHLLNAIVGKLHVPQPRKTNQPEFREPVNCCCCWCDSC
jgi:hypothetical protein